MQEKNNSRRTFLKQSMLGASAIMLSLAKTAQAENVKSALSKSKITLINIEECIACGSCVTACKERNAHRYPDPKHPIVQPFPESRAKIEDWSDRKDIDDRLTPYNWLYIQEVNLTWQGKEHTLNIPRRCMHCNNPICAGTCPFGAMQKQESGTVTCDPKLCLGGAKCRTVCPWGIPQRQSGVGLYLKIGPMTDYAGNGVMYKCDRCDNIVAKNGIPACIEYCPQNVQQIGTAEEILPLVQQAKEAGKFIYGLDEAGGTSTIYISPLPFSAIQMALRRDSIIGQGKPSFKETKQAATASVSLARIALAAPLMGAAVGLISLRTRKKNTQSS